MSTNLEIHSTDIFSDYLSTLKDFSARIKILARLKRLEQGNWGDHSSVGEGVIELRINSGPGYRVYCIQRGTKIIIVLGAGTKNRQQVDIDSAKAAAKAL